MENYADHIEKLLKKECYIIDFLPKQVENFNDAQFFDVEYYLLNSEKYYMIKDKFVGVILKLMCYYHMCILWNGMVDRPKPELIENAISEIMSNHSGTLNCIFPDENILLVFDWDCLNLSVYNPSEKSKQLFEQIAFSEGLFWRATK